MFSFDLTRSDNVQFVDPTVMFGENGENDPTTIKGEVVILLNDMKIIILKIL